MKADYSETANLVDENQKNISTFIHISTFLKWFFPFANFIAPLLIWTFNKEKPFVDEHGKQAINFQLSLMVYSILLVLLCIPFAIVYAADFISVLERLEHHNLMYAANLVQSLSGYLLLFGIVFLLMIALFILEIYAVINASIHASRGELYQYPLCIPFIKTQSKTHTL